MGENATGTLAVAEDACQMSQDRSRGTVVVQSNDDDFPRAIEELGGVDARNLALQYAAQCGMGDPRINGNTSGAYPVNSEGKALDAVRDKDGNVPPPQAPEMQIAHYRIDIPVCRPIV